MRDILEHGALWPGMIFRKGDKFEAQYRDKVQLCNSYAEAEGWIIDKKLAEEKAALAPRET